MPGSYPSSAIRILARQSIAPSNGFARSARGNLWHMAKQTKADREQKPAQKLPGRERRMKNYEREQVRKAAGAKAAATREKE